MSERMVYDVGWGASDIVKRVVDCKGGCVHKTTKRIEYKYIICE